MNRKQSMPLIAVTGDSLEIDSRCRSFDFSQLGVWFATVVNNTAVNWTLTGRDDLGYEVKVCLVKQLPS